MNTRGVIKKVQGRRAVDGAGVSLVRVLGQGDVKDFDPFLMLDSFDSTNPRDYLAGFPMHPHRGIETVTYLVSGRIDHEDSLGHKGSIGPGESQWMVAGSGILHQEMPQASQRMLGLQLWVNLPKADKMSAPAYQSITDSMVAKTTVGSAKIGVISGRAGNAQGMFKPKHVQASICDVTLPKGEGLVLPTAVDENVFIFLLEGDCVIAGERIAEKTAVLFGEGGEIAVSAAPERDLRFVFFSGKPLREPVAWGGPIVMNTREELYRAFDELDRGTFIKHH
jgi:redox-sensitive bicupin YhaK (pirin superfamily)